YLPTPGAGPTGRGGGSHTVGRPTPRPSAASTASMGTAPARRIRGGSTEQSTIVDGGPPWAAPPSRTRATASPSWSRISAASRASGTPDTFADVVGSGPTAAASERGASWSGTRRPIV